MTKDKDKNKASSEELKGKELEQKVHDAFLTDEEKAEIEKEVREELDAENKKRVASDYKKSLISAAKKKALMKDAKEGETEDGLVPIFIDLPSVSECIRIDGVAYYPGRTYHVRAEVRELMLEIMHRGDMHEDEISGRRDSNLGRAKRQSKVKPQ